MNGHDEKLVRPRKRGSSPYSRWMDEAADDALQHFQGCATSREIVYEYLKRRWSPRPGSAAMAAIWRRMQVNTIAQYIVGANLDQAEERRYIKSIKSKLVRDGVRKMLKNAKRAELHAPAAPDAYDVLDSAETSNPRRRGRRPGGGWSEWKWNFIRTYEEMWGHQPRDEGYRSRDYFPFYADGMSVEEAADHFGRMNNDVSERRRNPAEPPSDEALITEGRELMDQLDFQKMHEELFPPEEIPSGLMLEEDEQIASCEDCGMLSPDVREYTVVGEAGEGGWNEDIYESPYPMNLCPHCAAEYEAEGMPTPRRNPRGQYMVYVDGTREKYGPYDLKTARDFARIGSQTGRERLVKKGRKLIRRYGGGRRVWPTRMSQMKKLTSAERPREL